MKRKLDAPGRLALRQEKSAPIVADLRRWLDAHLYADTPADPLTKALNYLHNHWHALTRFLMDGRFPVDNNLAERMLRAVAIGRNNYLFARSDAAAERTAVFYTFVMTCRVNGVDRSLG
ncbi:MAG: transposase [Myxococcota bacterium]